MVQLRSGLGYSQYINSRDEVGEHQHTIEGSGATKRKRSTSSDRVGKRPRTSSESVDNIFDRLPNELLYNVFALARPRPPSWSFAQYVAMDRIVWYHTYPDPRQQEDMNGPLTRWATLPRLFDQPWAVHIDCPQRPGPSPTINPYHASWATLYGLDSTTNYMIRKFGWNPKNNLPGVGGPQLKQKFKAWLVEWMLREAAVYFGVNRGNIRSHHFDYRHHPTRIRIPRFYLLFDMPDIQVRGHIPADEAAVYAARGINELLTGCTRLREVILHIHLGLWNMASEDNTDTIFRSAQNMLDQLAVLAPVPPICQITVQVVFRVILGPFRPWREEMYLNSAVYDFDNGSQSWARGRVTRHGHYNFLRPTPMSGIQEIWKV